MAEGQLYIDIEAEKEVLSACLNLPEAACEAACLLRAEDFGRASHRQVFAAIASLEAERKDVDAVTVADRMSQQGTLERAGGRPMLAELASCSFALLAWRRAAEIMERHSMRRRLERAAAQIAGIAAEGADDANELAAAAEGALAEATKALAEPTSPDVSDLANQAMAEAMAAREGSAVAVKTGFDDLDRLTGGLRPGDLVVLAARPGVGKTALALNMALRAAKAGTHVAFYSLEMSGVQLMQRLIAIEAQVPLCSLRAGMLLQADWQAVAQAASIIGGLPLSIDDAGGLTPARLRAKARRAMRDAEHGRGLVVVDYLQLMAPSRSRREATRAIEVAEFSRSLKELAKEIGQPVVALSQLSRAIESRGGPKRPMLSDLRESGAIEQAADMVAFLDRSMDESEAAHENRPDLGVALVILAKHRNGPTGDVALAFNAPHNRFTSFYAGREGEQA